MANTTDIMITTLFDKEAIEFINKNTDLNFKQVTDGEKSGGSKVLSFEVYGTCVRSIGKKAIEHLITVFRLAPFESPEYAVLLIDDDNEEFNGIVRRDILWQNSKEEGYRNCSDCVWHNQPEGCNVKRDSEVCKLNKKLKKEAK